jgi:hypothetical protein
MLMRTPYTCILKNTRTQTQFIFHGLRNISPLFCMFLFILCLFTSCHAPEKKTTLMELLPASKTGIDFTNKLQEDEDLNTGFILRCKYVGQQTLSEQRTI